jgi:hypothetical protein
MKQISHLLLLSIFLASCAVTPAPNAAVAPQPTVTFTPTPTDIPATPTDTPDPNAPQGFTRHENGMYYLDKVEDGINVTYTYMVEKNSNGEVLFEGWTKEKTKGQGIPLYDAPDSIGIPNFAFIRLVVTSGVSGGAHMPEFSHKLPSEAQMNELALGQFVVPQLYKRIYGVTAQGGPALNAFIKSVARGEVPFTFFTTTKDELQTWSPSSTHGALVIVDDYNKMEGTPFWDFEHKMQFKAEILGVSSDGQLVVRMSGSVPADQWTEEAYYEAIFLGAADVINGPDNTKVGLNGTLSTWCAYVLKQSQSAVTGEKYIHIEPVK